MKYVPVKALYFGEHSQNNLGKEQGVLKRALNGNASNPKRAITLGEYVPAFAEGGLKALNG